jgi:hypothetical protein
MQERTRELDPAAVSPGELRGLVMGALGQSQPRELLLDMACASARGILQTGMKQKVGRDVKLEVEGGLLKDDTESAPAPAPRRASCRRPPSPRCAGIRREQAESNWNSVVLPAPLGPSRAMNSSGWALRLTPSMARTARSL